MLMIQEFIPSISGSTPSNNDSPQDAAHVYDLIRSSMDQSLIYFTSFHMIDFYYTCAWMTCQVLHNVLYLFDAFLYVYADRLSTSIFISNVLCDISPKKNGSKLMLLTNEGV